MVDNRLQKSWATTKQSIEDSLRSFRAHRLRTLLTSLGVIFGVAAVIAMLAITEGAKRDAISAIERLGLRNIYVIQQAEAEKADEAKKINPDGLTQDDGVAIAAITPGVERVVPSVRKFENVRSSVLAQGLSVVGTQPEYFYATNRTIRLGRFLHDIDEQSCARVVVLGAESAKKLFPTEPAVGKYVRIRQDPYRVVGVLDPMGTSWKIPGMPDWEPDKEVFVPLKTTVQLLMSGSKRNTAQVLLVQMESEQNIDPGTKVIKQIIDRRHRGAPDFKVIVPEELLAQSRRTQRTFTIIMAAIAGISLLVGGIGIMNIMLSSVLERTQEIGIRRAVGATQWEIARQFLTEAALLSGGGGFIGMILGIALAYIVTITAGWVTVITIWSVVVSLGVAVAVGIVFGMFPAKQAARLDPIEALRYSG